MSGGPSFPANPTVGQLYTYGTTTWQWNGTQWVNATQGQNFLPVNQAPLENYIDNSGFPVNQRSYSSGTALAAGAYGPDRWKAGAAGCTMTSTGAGSDFTQNITAGSLQQVIEGVELITATYTLSWVGTATGRISTTSGGGTYAASPVQFSATSNTNTFVEFTGGTVSRVKLQLGSVAALWQPTPFALEIVRCQRFYEPIPATQISQYGAGAWGNVNTISFLVQKRAAPTITGVVWGSSGSATGGSVTGNAITYQLVTTGNATAPYSISLNAGAAASADL